MPRRLAVVGLVVCLALAGCNLGGPGPGTPTDTPAPTVTAEPTPETTPTPAAPPVESLSFADGTALNTSALARAQFDFFERSEGYTVRSNVSFAEPAQGDVVARTDLRAVDFGTERALGRTALRYANGTERSSGAFFFNSTTVAVRSGPPGESSVQTRALQRPFRSTGAARFADNTAFEFVGTLDYEFDDAVRRDGRWLYRFTGEGIAADLSDQERQVRFGGNATVESATLLVTGEGLVVDFETRFSGDRPTGRRTVTAQYRASDVNATTVAVPDWVP